MTHAPTRQIRFDAELSFRCNEATGKPEELSSIAIKAIGEEGIKILKALLDGKIKGLNKCDPNLRSRKCKVSFFITSPYTMHGRINSVRKDRA